MGIHSSINNDNFTGTIALSLLNEAEVFKTSGNKSIKISHNDLYGIPNSKNSSFSNLQDNINQNINENDVDFDLANRTYESLLEISLQQSSNNDITNNNNNNNIENATQAFVAEEFNGGIDIDNNENEKELFTEEQTNTTQTNLKDIFSIIFQHKESPNQSFSYRQQKIDDNNNNNNKSTYDEGEKLVRVEV